MSYKKSDSGRAHSSTARKNTSEGKNFSKRSQSRGAQNAKSFGRRYDEDRPATERVCVSKPNDKAWYALNDQLLRDTASFPYSWPLGRSLNLNKFGANINKGSLPGLFTMQWTPTIGNATDATSAINVASINTYTKIRHDNSGHANYDHQDYMLFLLAMDSVYSFHSWMRRVYGVALTYSNVNRYYPAAVISSMGVDFKDLQQKLADFRAYINQYAIKASALAVPAKMSYMTKHYWMNEGLYFDSNQDKPQTYMFQPTGFYKFALDESTKAGKLIFEPLLGKETAPAVPGKNIPKSASTAKLTVAQIIEFGDKLLDPIIADEDFGIMSGDTLKSFGASGCYTLPITDEKYTVVPSYNTEVLDQIQNATLVGDIIIEDATISQDTAIGTGAILAHPTFSHPWVSVNNPGTELPGQNAFLTDRIVTFDHGDITPGDTMEATRWTNIAVEVTDKQTRSYHIPTLGSEVMNFGFITYFAMPGGSAQGQLVPTMSDKIYVSMNFAAPSTAGHIKVAGSNNRISENDLKDYLQTLVDSSLDTVMKTMLTVQQLGMFSRHPAIALTSYSDIKATIQYPSGDPVTADYHDYGVINGYLYDVNYYTILSSRDLESMSHIALLSEFDVTVR